MLIKLGEYFKSKQGQTLLIADIARKTPVDEFIELVKQYANLRLGSSYPDITISKCYTKIKIQ